MAHTGLMALNGQEVSLYNTGNTNKGIIKMSGTAVSINGAGSGVIVDVGNNLLFAGSTASVGGVNPAIITMGRTGDTIELNASGITYHLPSLNTHSDTNISTLSTGQVLNWNGTMWANTSDLSVTSLTTNKEGFALTLNHPTSGGNTGIVFNSKVNAGSDKGFLIYQDDSAFTGNGAGSESSRLVMGVYNDIVGGTTASDEIWIQGGARLVQNVGAWDSELNTIIGSTTSAATSGYEWRINNGTASMALNNNGYLGVGTASPTTLLDVRGSITSRTTSDGNFLTLYAEGARIHYINRVGQILKFTSDGSNAYDVQFDSSNKSIYLASNGGKVGVGTITLTEALTVSGNIAVSGTVDGLDISDFNTNINTKRARYTKSLSPGIVANTATTLTTIDATWTGTWSSDSIVLVIIDGTIQAPGIDYNTSGTNTLTFLGNIPSGTILEVIIM